MGGGGKIKAGRGWWQRIMVGRWCSSVIAAKLWLVVDGGSKILAGGGWWWVFMDGCDWL